jgi:hypothetical protein
MRSGPKFGHGPKVAALNRSQAVEAHTEEAAIQGSDGLN